jgi:hypothetical protein
MLDLYHKKLRTLLSRAEDEAFFQMIWAIDALQSDRVEAAAKCLRYPAEAATAKFPAPYSLHKWELETLIGQLLITPKAAWRPGPNRVANCTQFNTGAMAVNLLRKVENIEAGHSLEAWGLFQEMNRLGYRQFEWQQGYVNLPNLYRYAYIYGQGECAEYFQQSYGISINQFSLTSFALYATLRSEPAIKRATSLETFGITPSIAEATLQRLSKKIGQAREEACSINRSMTAKYGLMLPTGYRPSLLRQYPVIAFGNNGERLRAPLPDLVLLRATAGLFYDIVGGPSRLRNDVSQRFESYSAEYIEVMLPTATVKRSHQYKRVGNNIDTPDVLVLNDSGEVVLSVECKATRLAFETQFAKDPIAEGKSEYDEIAKGIFQIWRYYSHSRRGLTGDAISADACGIVLTLNTLLMIRPDLYQHVFAAAEVYASKESEISAEDRRRIVICSIKDFEYVLARSDEDLFFRTILAAGEPAYAGWLLSSVHQELAGENSVLKPFPFDLGQVLPWWARRGGILAEPS